MFHKIFGISKSTFREAAEKGNLKTVQKYIAANQDNNAMLNTSDISGYTALMLAAGNGHVDVVNALVANSHIQINATNTYGNTALFFAASHDHMDIVKILLNHQANAQHRNTNYSTATEEAQKKGHTEMAQFLASFTSNREQVKPTEDKHAALPKAPAEPAKNTNKYLSTSPVFFKSNSPTKSKTSASALLQKNESRSDQELVFV